MTAVLISNCMITAAGAELHVIGSVCTLVQVHERGCEPDIEPCHGPDVCGPDLNTTVPVDGPSNMVIMRLLGMAAGPARVNCRVVEAAVGCAAGLGCATGPGSKNTTLVGACWLLLVE